MPYKIARHFPRICATSPGLKQPSVINCDQLTRLEKNMLSDYVGKLSSKKLHELRTALRVALDVD
jgi:mRNA-degrading endonuclease toxin of MazEF toxin-antitoxin module